MASLQMKGIAAAILLLSASSWALRGLVLDTAGRPVPAVEVRASWGDLSDTTDSVGSWSVDDATGIVRNSGSDWVWSAGRVQVLLEAAANLRLDAFDPAGRRLWSRRQDGVPGWNGFDVPERVDVSASVVRVRTSTGTLRFLRRGGHLAAVPASRSAGLRAVSFRRSGYYDVLREIPEGQDTVLTVLRRAPDTTGKVAPVRTSPDTGVHAAMPYVTFFCATPGVTFFYTLDSSAPRWDAATLKPLGASTFSWSTGSAGIGLTRSVWLRVAAGRHGMLASDTLTGRFVYIGDSALIDDFEGQGFGSLYAAQGLSWFACQYRNGEGCSQDQRFQRDRTLPLLDTVAPDYDKRLGKRAWRVQVSIAKAGEDGHPGYAGCAVRVPPTYPDAAYRLVFRAKFQDTGSAVPRAAMPMVVEMALKGNAQNNGGYMDGFHRRILTVTASWKLYEIDFVQFRAAGNGYAPAALQPDSTSTDPRTPAIFWEDPTMPALGLSGYQGDMAHGSFSPAWTWGVSKDAAVAKSDIVGFRFSLMQPMDSAAAASVGRVTDSVVLKTYGDHAHWKDPREPAYTQDQLEALVKGIHGYLWIDNITLVRKSI